MSTTEVVRSLAIVSGVLAWGMALILARYSRQASANAPLILAFVGEGGIQLATGLPPTAAFPWSPTAQRVLETLAPIAFGLIPWSYLLFLGRLERPLARGLRRRPVRAGLIVTLLVMPLWAGLGIAFVGLGSEGAWWEPPYFTLNALALVTACVLGLVIGVSAVRHAEPGSLRRERALAIAWGFGLRDALIVLGLGLQLVANAGLAFLEPFSPAPLALATLVSVPILAVGVLRTQLFDAQLRVRIRRGTVAAAFVALYVVAAQGIVTALAPRIGLTLALTVAALLVLLLVPLERGAEALAARGSADPEGANDRDGTRRVAGDDRAELDTAGRGETLLFGRLRVLGPLGEGGQGTTRLCEDVRIGRRVAVKTIRPDGPSDGAVREARALAAVSHPAIVTLYDVVLEGDRLHLVLEHVPGGSLAGRLQSGALAADEWSLVARDLAAALVALDDAGLVHGDIKPSNVLLRTDGGAKLADFGLARWQEIDATRHDLAGAQAGGSLRYMAPEQALGARARAASDQYALAATLVEARTGRALVEPRPGESAHELLARVSRCERTEDALEALPTPVGEALRPALAQSPSDRYPHARDLAAALERAMAELTQGRR